MAWASPSIAATAASTTAAARTISPIRSCTTKTARRNTSLTDESGTIIRVSPDFKSHEIVATGIRFPVALRFNPRGDLFATDQEGATWVPNGNPFDELLHIQRGRHYGFPARHPKYLPNVIDEPSTFDYSPQHQSTCGLNFNEPVRAGWTDVRSGGVGRRRDRHRLFARQVVSHEAVAVARRLRRANATCSRA